MAGRGGIGVARSGQEELPGFGSACGWPPSGSLRVLGGGSPGCALGGRGGVARTIFNSRCEAASDGGGLEKQGPM